LGKKSVLLLPHRLPLLEKGGRPSLYLFWSKKKGGLIAFIFGPRSHGSRFRRSKKVHSLSRKILRGEELPVPGNGFSIITPLREGGEKLGSLIFLLCLSEFRTLPTREGAQHELSGKKQIDTESEICRLLGAHRGDYRGDK